MAQSPEAAALTDDYRRRQAQLGAFMLGQLGLLWPKFDPAKIEQTREPWLRAVVGLVAQGYTASATLAAAYLPAFRTLEGAPGALPDVPLAVPDLERIIAVNAYLGPIRHYERLRGGMDADQSWRISRDQTLAAGQQHVLNGGRDQTTTTVARDKSALGFVRVASGSACAFCAMLASRGPDYKSARSASFQAHPGCNCTAEPVYHAGADAWPPRSRIYADEWQTVTKGLSGDDARIAWRRHHEGRAGTAETTQGAATKSGRGKTLKRSQMPDMNDPAQRAAANEAQLAGLRANLPKLEARHAAGEDVATALEWNRQRIALLETELGPEATARATVKAADLAAASAERAAASTARREAFEARIDERNAALRGETPADKAQAARAAEEAEEAQRVALAEQERAAEAARAVDEGLELAVDDGGIPYTLSLDYLRFLEEEDPELDTLVDYLAGRLDDGNPLELARWQDAEVYLDYKQAERTILEGAEDRAEEETSRLLAELARDRGRLGLTHEAGDVELLEEFAAAPPARPSRKQVQADYAVYVEELYVRAQDATRGHLLSPKGRAAGIDGRSLFSGDVRRVLRYGSEELLEFFEGTRRVQWSEFYAERTGSQAFASAAARQRRISEGISRDRNVIDLVTNREA